MPNRHITKVPPEMQELSDQIGSFIEYWGFKKIHGQIWTHIFLADEPIDATTLGKRLNVSKALISLAIHDLLKYDVVQVVGKGSRRILYQSNPDLIKVICSVLRMRERKMLAQIMSSYKNLTKLCDKDRSTNKLCYEKTQALGEMIEAAEQTLDALIASDLHLEVDQAIDSISKK